MTATSTLGRLLRVEPREWSKVLLFALLGALLQGGVAVGVGASDSLFLAHVGASALPVVYVLSLLVSLAYVRIYGRLLARYGIGWTLTMTVALLAAGGVAIRGALALMPQALDTPGSHATLYGVKLYSLLWFIALYSLQWSFSDRYFDIQDAKRLFPILSAGSAAGAAAGGGLVAVLGRTAGVESLFVVWAVLALLAMPVVLAVRRRYRPAEEEDDTRAGDAGRASSLVHAVRSSPYVLLLTASLFTVLVVTSVCEYQYLGIFAADRSSQQLASLLGRLMAAANGLNLLLSLLVFHRLVSWLGVRNTALVQPLAYAATFAVLFVNHGEAAAVLGFMTHQALLTSIDYNNSNLLLKALPAGAKRGIRTFIEGIGEPLAVAAAGALLLVAARLLSPEEVSGVGLAGSAVCLALVLGVRSEYPEAMVRNLRREWVEFSAGGRLAEAEQMITFSAEDSRGLLPAMLDATVDASPRERRAVASAVAGLGLRMVPAALAVVEDPSQPHRARSLAARIIGQLAPAQLGAVADELVRAELRRAEEYGATGALLAGRRRGAGLNTLYHLCHEIPTAIVDFVLEVYALTGRLPSAEMLASSLHSANTRERSEAFETLEQGCPRSVYRTLSRLLRQPVTGRGVGGVLLEERLGRARDSAIALERAAAVVAAPEVFPEEQAREWIRPVLGRREPPLVRETALAVLAELVGAGSDDPNTIRIIDIFKRAPLLTSFQTTELAFLVEARDRVEPERGQLVYDMGEPPDGAYGVLAGAVALSLRGGASVRCEAGAVFGADDLFGTAREDTAVSLGARLVRIAVRRFAECARRFPTAGLRFVARKHRGVIPA